MTTRSGYAVTIRGFLPVDPSDLDQHEKVLAAIREARSPSGPPNTTGADPMLGWMEVEVFEVRPVTRRGKEEAGAT